MCNYEGCNKWHVYCLEWWSLDQRGEDPISEEHLCLYSCHNPEHILYLAKEGEGAFGGFPDEVHEVESGEAKTELLKLINITLEGKLNFEEFKVRFPRVNPPKEQIRLFPE